ncbi:MAG: hypothetical protein ACLT98_02970 [Eggerthellaceae bacterium]
MQWACQAGQDAAAATGNVETMLSTCEQLIKDESGAIAGIYVHDAMDGAYTKINCKSRCNHGRRAATWKCAATTFLGPTSS